MALTDGVFTCVTGDMPLSSAMHATLSERFPTHRPRPAGVEVGRRLTGWFCPGYGVPLDPEISCSTCGGSIWDQLFHLVELYPHFEEQELSAPSA